MFLRENERIKIKSNWEYYFSRDLDILIFLFVFCLETQRKQRRANLIVNIAQIGLLTMPNLRMRRY